jgi:hypothetical protein
MFAYASPWLTSGDLFMISPDLMMVEGHPFRRAPSRDDSIFHFCFADTEPDGWGWTVSVESAQYAYRMRRETFCATCVAGGLRWGHATKECRAGCPKGAYPRSVSAV